MKLWNLWEFETFPQLLPTSVNYTTFVEPWPCKALGFVQWILKVRWVWEPEGWFGFECLSEPHEMLQTQRGPFSMLHRSPPGCPPEPTHSITSVTQLPSNHITPLTMSRNGGNSSQKQGWGPPCPSDLWLNSSPLGSEVKQEDMYTVWRK